MDTLSMQNVIFCHPYSEMNNSNNSLIDLGKIFYVPRILFIVIQ